MPTAVGALRKTSGEICGLRSVAETLARQSGKVFLLLDCATEVVYALLCVAAAICDPSIRFEMLTVFFGAVCDGGEAR